MSYYGVMKIIWVDFTECNQVE